MGQLPEFFQHSLEIGADTTLYPFLYDAYNKEFAVADVPVSLDDFDPYGFDPHSVGLDDKGIPAEEIGKHSLYLPIMPGRLIVAPSLHHWAENNPATLSQTWKIMRDAYQHLSGFESKSRLSDEPTTTHIGYAAGLREYSGIHLQTMGNCACMGPIVDGIYINDLFENGYAEYDMHNADESYQRASLFAGMGHIAQLATISE